MNTLTDPPLPPPLHDRLTAKMMLDPWPYVIVAFLGGLTLGGVLVGLWLTAH